MTRLYENINNLYFLLHTHKRRKDRQKAASFLHETVERNAKQKYCKHKISTWEQSLLSKRKQCHLLTSFYKCGKNKRCEHPHTRAMFDSGSLKAISHKSVLCYKTLIQGSRSLLFIGLLITLFMKACNMVAMYWNFSNSCSISYKSVFWENQLFQKEFSRLLSFSCGLL